MGKIVADGLYVRAGLLLLLFEDYRQDRIARVNAVKPGQEVLSGYVQQWPGVRAVEQAAGQGAMFIPQATPCGFVIKGTAPGAVFSLEFEKFMDNRGGRCGQRLEGQFAQIHGHQVVEAQPARPDEQDIPAMQGRTALAAAGPAALASRGAAHGSRSRLSPRRSMPGTITLVKMPSRGMMQSPTCLKMAQPWWHFLPIWVTSSTTSPLPMRVPIGKWARSIPSVVMFSAKAPGVSSNPLARMKSIDSSASRLTWRCQSPAWASPTMPWSTLSSTLSTGSLLTPFSRLMFNEMILPMCSSLKTGG